MDLSNLSNDLPSTNSTASNTNTTATTSVNQELTNHFKDAAKSVASLYHSSLNAGNNDHTKNVKQEFANAAKSVASLYKLSKSSQHISHDKGYLQCLDDILAVLANDEDVEDWVLTKRIALVNQNNNKPESSQQSTESEVLNIPSDYEFTFSSDLKPPVHFRPSIPPISVQHNLKQRASIGNPHTKYNKKAMYSDDMMSEDLSESDEKSSLHKYFSDSPVKKKKKFNN
ncbi:hypothetical protein SBY92_003999 [Candida maltosa Xu316]